MRLISRTGPLVRLHQLGGERRALLARAAVLLTAASAAVALGPFAAAIRFGSARLAAGKPRDIADCVWAVEAAARRLPWRTMCIEKGIALQRLLRRGGIDALLHYGGRHDPESGALQAHVWVTVDGVMVIGGEEASAYAEIACFP